MSARNLWNGLSLVALVAALALFLKNDLQQANVLLILSAVYGVRGAIADLKK